MPNDIVLTDEMKKRLKEAGAIGFTLENNFPYTPGAYKTKDNDDYVIPKALWPVFTLRGLDGVERAKIEDLGKGKVSFNKDGESTIKTDMGKLRLMTLKKGIVTWNNFVDEKGVKIPKPEKDPIDNGIKEDFLRYIPSSLQIELSGVIMNNGSINEEEKLGLE